MLSNWDSPGKLFPNGKAGNTKLKEIAPMLTLLTPPDFPKPTPRRASKRRNSHGDKAASHHQPPGGELHGAEHTSDPALLPSSTRTPAPSVAGHQRPDLIASHPLNNKKSGPGLEKSEKTACAPSQIAI